MKLVQLYFEFFKAGLFAIGGGLATLPFLYAISDKTGWFTYGDLANMVAISESTPGPIGVNMATYVGYDVSGLVGAVVATIGLITPSIIVILLVAAFLKSFKDNAYVKQVFYGLRPASSGLIAAALVAVMQISLINVEAFKGSHKMGDLFVFKNLVLAGILLFLTNYKPLKKVHPAFFLLFSAIVGICFQFAY